MAEKLWLSVRIAASLVILLCLTPLWARPASEGEVRTYINDGLATVVFEGESGGAITVFFPLNISASDSQIGGTVERLLPAPGPKTTPKLIEEQTAEIAGVVTVEPSNAPGNSAKATCPPENPSFTCAVPSAGAFVVTYQPLKGAARTATLEIPIQKTADTKKTCDIPKLTSNAGNMHVSMPCTSGDPKINTCEMNGIAAVCRAWSSEGCVFEVPASNQLPPGPCSVHVKRGNDVATGQTLVAQVKLTCSPKSVKQGQKCKLITEINCPGLKTISDGILSIRNYDPHVIKLEDKQVPIANADGSFRDETDATGGQTGKYAVYASVFSAPQSVPVVSAPQTAGQNSVPQ